MLVWLCGGGRAVVHDVLPGGRRDGRGPSAGVAARLRHGAASSVLDNDVGRLEDALTGPIPCGRGGGCGGGSWRRGSGCYGGN